MADTTNKAGAREYAAPARVNLIGEHTDYTGGLVMPMAIGFHTVGTIEPRPDGIASFYSANFNETIEVPIVTLGRNPRGHWSDYPVGVLWSLMQAGYTFSGFNLRLHGDVPVGAGLSSSASIEVATAIALLGFAGQTMPLKEIAVAARRAENEFVGAKSGIMDQFVVAGGVADRAMLLDCRSLEYELLPLPQGVRVVICNSMVKHQVATGEYGGRRDEVEAGQAILRKLRGIDSLRDATVEDLDACATEMGQAVFKRCRHVVTENARVLAARKALNDGDIKGFGNLMIEAHKSFRDDFEASCSEVDTLVEIAIKQAGCFGARITGGGFGGCTVNVVEIEHADTFVETLKREYKLATGIEADCFVCEASDGALALEAKAVAK
ncbi:galactokinase [Granulicella sibirica]|uniref:Galactokinase n=1 Tax=Granulicella sibirica TaxID=2479048 RepID=A0A4V1L5C9_9BACT|nr:galactokinase [Granulicella sibirica]RXH55324.1 Galactokinase [Granulicella sibirica]